MSATRRMDSEEFGRAQAAAREIRETVADQLHDLVIERDSFAEDDELVAKVQAIGEISKRVREARGRQAQAQEMGIPVTPALRQERDARVLLRSAVMSLGATCGAWAAAMDFEVKRDELDAGARNGKRQRRRSDEDDDI